MCSKIIYIYTVWVDERGPYPTNIKSNEHSGFNDGFWFNRYSSSSTLCEFVDWVGLFVWDGMKKTLISNCLEPNSLEGPCRSSHRLGALILSSGYRLLPFIRSWAFLLSTVTPVPYLWLLCRLAIWISLEVSILCTLSYSSGPLGFYNRGYHLLLSRIHWVYPYLVVVAASSCMSIGLHYRLGLQFLFSSATGKYSSCSCFITALLHDMGNNRPYR